MAVSAQTCWKTVKRVMAGEYSRELSVKVFAGQCRLVEKGFRQGGMAGYGLCRLLKAPAACWEISPRIGRISGRSWRCRDVRCSAESGIPL